MTPPINVSIIGRGKVGSALARGLRAAGATVRLVGHEHVRIAREASVVILAVPDARIRGLAQQLAPRLRERVLLHCAGARGPDELAPARVLGASVATFHPLVSFAHARQPADFVGKTFVSCGDAKATSSARKLAHLLGAHFVELAALGPGYHAAASLVANGAAALANVGVKILCQLGMERSAAERGLAGMLASVAQNVAALGVPAALTGPVVRGDAATVARHLAALAPAERAAYASVVPIVLACARQAGLDERAARAIERVLAAPPSARDKRPRRPAGLQRPPRTTATRGRAAPRA